MTRKFLLVGLTGGVATGKSTVAEILRRLGCVIIDADVVAREVVAPGEPAHDDIVAEFGRGILQRDGTLDRQKLGVIVFAVPEKRKRLEAITHPRIRERLARRLEELAARGFAGIVVFDAPLIIESGNATTMDRLVVVVTDEATQAPRLTARDGPGAAEALTGELARRAGRVVALEIDRGLVEGLRARVPSVEVIEADARVWDYGALARPRDGRVLVVGNLPYSVGKPILAALIAARTAIDEMALMLQREVAERVAAAPGGKTYGSLSILSQLYCDARVALRVPPSAFRPPPQVESAVLHLRVRPAPCVPLADERRFHAVVRSAFAQRRKTLANALAAGLGLPLEVVRATARTAGVGPGRRGGGPPQILFSAAPPPRLFWRGRSRSPPPPRPPRRPLLSP